VTCKEAIMWISCDMFWDVDAHLILFNFRCFFTKTCKIKFLNELKFSCAARIKPTIELYCSLVICLIVMLMSFIMDNLLLLLLLTSISYVMWILISVMSCCDL